MNNNETINKVTIDLDKQLVAPNELDFLILFLESKKQSGGGDLIRHELSSDFFTLTVYYEDKEAQQRVLDKKILQFKNYTLYLSQNGLIQSSNETYSLNSNQIIISNLIQDEEFFVKIYAENLLPYNEIKQLTKSRIFAHTYFVTYTTDLDRSILNERFKTRQMSKTNQIHLMDSFQTDMFLIKSINLKLNSNDLRVELESKKIESFLKEINTNLVLCQCKIPGTDLAHLISDYLKDKNLICESCFNFDLLRLKSSSTPTTTTNKMIQTDLNEPPIINEVINNQILELNSLEDLNVDALLNAKQLFINFEDVLKRLDKNLVMKRKNANLLVIQNTNASNQIDAWKKKVTNELKKFFTTKAQSKIVKIPADLVNQSKLLSQKLLQINKEYPAVYLRIINNDIVCHGTKNALANRLDKLSDLFKSINPNLEQKPLVQQTQAQSNQINNPSTIELAIDSLLNKVLIGMPQIFYDFKNSLKDHNADLLKQEKQIVIRCLTNETTANNVSWTNKINVLIDDYEKNRLRHKKISIPPNLRRQKEVDDLKRHCEHFFSKEKTLKFELIFFESTITAYGYQAQVKQFTDNIQSKFNNLDNNIKDRIRRKLDVKLEPTRIPMLHILTDTPTGYHFNEFNSQLVRLDAAAELLAPLMPTNMQKNNMILIRIKCNLNQTKQQNEQLVEQWRSKIDSFILNYFSMFVTKRQKVVGIKINSLKQLDEKVKLTWLDSDTIELTGIKADVERVTNELVNKNKNSRSKSNSVSSTSSSSNKENSAPKTNKTNIVNNPTSAVQVKQQQQQQQNEPAEQIQINRDDKIEETFVIKDLNWYLLLLKNDLF